jgi:hypothetical protein
VSEARADFDATEASEGLNAEAVSEMAVDGTAAPTPAMPFLSPNSFGHVGGARTQGLVAAVAEAIGAPAPG